MANYRCTKAKVLINFDKMLTLGHQQASLHSSRFIAFLASSRQKKRKTLFFFLFCARLAQIFLIFARFSCHVFYAIFVTYFFADQCHVMHWITRGLGLCHLAVPQGGTAQTLCRGRRARARLCRPARAGVGHRGCLHRDWSAVAIPATGTGAGLPGV